VCKKVLLTFITTFKQILNVFLNSISLKFGTFMQENILKLLFTQSNMEDECVNKLVHQLFRAELTKQITNSSQKWTINMYK